MRFFSGSGLSGVCGLELSIESNGAGIRKPQPKPKIPYSLGKLNAKPYEIPYRNPKPYVDLMRTLRGTLNPTILREPL